MPSIRLAFFNQAGILLRITAQLHTTASNIQVNKPVL